MREPDPDYASSDIYLHPVIRYYQGNHVVNEQHLAENLENNWLPKHFMFLRTTEVPGKVSEQSMLNYSQRLLAFLSQQF